MPELRCPSRVVRAYPPTRLPLTVGMTARAPANGLPRARRKEEADGRKGEEAVMGVAPRHRQTLMTKGMPILTRKN